jgi:hypothetical protein
MIIGIAVGGAALIIVVIVVVIVIIKRNKKTLFGNAYTVKQRKGTYSETSD